MVVSENEMKREFLQALQEESPLSKQTIDAIMAENGRDIQATRALFADYEHLKAELETAKQTITSLQEGSEQQFRQKLRQMEFQFAFSQAVAQYGGRNQKAVEALLDMPSLQAAENPEVATKEALKALQAENPWLFQSPTPPPYALGTGTQALGVQQPETLAGALREKFQRG